MEITDIRIRKRFPEGRLRALVSLTVGGDLAVHDIKVIQGPNRFFVAMPSRKEDSGRYRDIVHPISPEARRTLEEAVLSAYHAEAVADNSAYHAGDTPAASAEQEVAGD